MINLIQFMDFISCSYNYTIIIGAQDQEIFRIVVGLKSFFQTVSQKWFRFEAFIHNSI